MFGRGWEPGSATIVAMKETSPATTGDGGWYRALYAYVADVQPDSGGAMFRTEMDEPFEIPSWFAPGVGEVLPVQCEPRHGKAKFDMARLKAAAKARASAAKDEQIAEFEAARRAAPGTIVPGTLGNPGMVVLGGTTGDRGDVSATIAAALQQVNASPELAQLKRQKSAAQQTDGGDSVDRLQRLSDLHDRGALTDAEFAAAKAKILGES
jgi:hypothetical protein